jgi:NodT family efflux transporter outer membrane factor (OMF) lipoprotein
VAAQFPYAPAGGESGVAASELPWQEFFGDARLRRLIELALANNRDLRAAVLNIEAARAQVTAQRADLYPTLGVGATGLRQPGAGGNMTSLYTAGIAMSRYELDLFGRIRSLSDAAQARYLATEEARKAVQMSLIAAVANAHYAIAADDEQLEISRETLQSRQRTLELTQLRFDNGAASALDLSLAQTQAESARVSLARQARQREVDFNALVLLVGQPLPADLPPASRWDVHALPDVPAGLPSQVLLRRPDVVQAEQQLIAANADIGAARAAFWPNISLTASFGTASTHLADLFKSSAWSYAPQLFLPLFDAGRNRANLTTAQAQRDIAVAQYEGTIQSAFRDVADALASRVTLNEQLVAVRRQVDAEAERFRLSMLRFEAGVTSNFELLDAQRTLFVVQQEVVLTEQALLQARVAAYRALGGGWIEPAASETARR